MPGKAMDSKGVSSKASLAMEMELAQLMMTVVKLEHPWKACDDVQYRQERCEQQQQRQWDSSSSQQQQQQEQQ